jgi:teichoic acid D-alanine hydrolase
MKKLLNLLLICVPILLVGQTPQFSELINYYNTQKGFNGVVLVATDGRIDYLGSIGMANRQNGTLIHTKSKFKIASMTKVFTAILIMKLHEDGKLDLNKTIGEYYPEYKGEGRDKVTIDHLLTYSSGIQNKLDELGMTPYQVDETLDDFIETYCSGDLVTVPGEKSAYGNTEYILLHKIIENVSKVSYEAYLEDVILGPLKMEHTKMIRYKDITIGLLPSYTFNESLGILNNDEPYYPELYFGSGAMYATVEDLLKFDHAIFSNQLLQKETLKTFLTIHPELGYTAYGFWGSMGWGNFSEPFYYRTGAILGSTANWIHTMESGKTILVLSNTNTTNLYELSEKLYLTSIGKQIEIPKTEVQNSLLTNALEKLKGTWQIDLRPTPDSEAYLKDFMITSVSGKDFSGEFYGSQFSNGYLNIDWDKMYFAFTTSDSNNLYYHSGYFLGNKVFGISYSEGRKFITYWQGLKK